MIAALYGRDASAPFALLRMQFCREFHITPWDFDNKLDMADFYEWCFLRNLEQKAEENHQTTRMKAVQEQIKQAQAQRRH